MINLPLKKLLDYQGNHYELARASMEYSKKVRYLQPEDFFKSGEKDTIVALNSILDKKIRYEMGKVKIEDDEFNPLASTE